MQQTLDLKLEEVVIIEASPTVSVPHPLFLVSAHLFASTADSCPSEQENSGDSLLCPNHERVREIQTATVGPRVKDTKL